MKTLLFSFLLLIFALICSAQQVQVVQPVQMTRQLASSDPAIRSEQPLADSEQTGPSVLTTTIEDHYSWSKEQGRYQLVESQFKMALKMADSIEPKVVMQRVEKAQAGQGRYLVVQGNNHVSFISDDNSEPRQVRAQLSDDRQSLLVYFPDPEKQAIFNGLLKSVQEKSIQVALRQAGIQQASMQQTSIKKTDVQQQPLKPLDMSMSSYSCQIKAPHRLQCVMLSRLVLPSSKLDLH